MESERGCASVPTCVCTRMRVYAPVCVYTPVCVHTCACVCTLVRVYAPVRECARVPVHVPTACIARGHSAPLIAPFLPGVPPAGPGGLGSYVCGSSVPHIHFIPDLPILHVLERKKVTVVPGFLCPASFEPFRGCFLPPAVRESPTPRLSSGWLALSLSLSYSFI